MDDIRCELPLAGLQSTPSDRAELVEVPHSTPMLIYRWPEIELRMNIQSPTRGTYAMSEHHYHAVVWIDHHEARVFHFSPTDMERLVLHPDHRTRPIHHKANSIGSGHAAEDQA